MKFKFKFRLNTSKLPPQAHRGIEIIRALPDGELYDTNSLAGALNSNVGSIAQWVSQIPSEITCLHKRKRIYGNAKTIQAFKKEFGI